jgi:hypothetical protein
MCLSFGEASSQRQQPVISRHHKFIQSANSQLKEFLSRNVCVNATSCVWVCSRVHDNGVCVFRNVNELQLICWHHVEFLMLLSKRRFVAIRYTWRAVLCFIATDCVRFEFWSWWLTNAYCIPEGDARRFAIWQLLEENYRLPFKGRWILSYFV